jgi:hypothetical protein
MGKNNREPRVPYATKHGEAFDRTLIKLWIAGDSTSAIAKDLGRQFGLTLTKNMIIGFRNRLQLDPRPTPIRRYGPGDVLLPPPPPARRQSMNFKPVQPMYHSEWQTWFNTLPINRRRDIATAEHKPLCAALKNSSGMWNCNCGVSLPPGRPPQQLAKPMPRLDEPVTVEEIRELMAEPSSAPIASGVPDAPPPEPPASLPPDLDPDEPDDDGDDEGDGQDGGGDDDGVEVEEDEVEYASARTTPKFDYVETCCFPLGGTGGKRFRYCNQPVATRRSSYCDEHRKLAYTKDRKPGEDNDEGKFVPIERRLLQNSANGRWS